MSEKLDIARDTVKAALGHTDLIVSRCQRLLSAVDLLGGSDPGTAKELPFDAGDCHRWARRMDAPIPQESASPSCARRSSNPILLTKGWPSEVLSPRGPSCLGVSQVPTLRHTCILEIAT
jgi:hypothetical protein